MNEYVRTICLFYLGKEKEALENLSYALLFYPQKRKTLLRLDPFLEMNEKVMMLLDQHKK